MADQKTAAAFTAVFLTSTLSHAGEWKHDETTDKMRGAKTAFDTVTSGNKVDFEFPYHGGSSLSIIVRKKSGKLDDIILAISSGQFDCNVIEPCKGAVKFGKGKVETLTLGTAADGRADVLFVANTSWFYKQLAKGGDVTIELPFYQGGRQQFDFNVDGMPR